MNQKNQVFTPKNVALNMLNIVGYNEKVYGKKVLEDSFGKGDILLLIVKRYIEVCLKDKYSLEEIRKGLEKDIYGVELNTELFNKCIKRLNELTLKYSLKPVKWKLYNGDSLQFNWKIKFDFIISNPPYIKYHELPVEERMYLRSTYESCNDGNFDYYYAFIENGLRLLSETGKMVYLIPNNLFKNVYAKKLREIIKKNIVHIFNYQNEEIFKGKSISPSIIMLENSSEQKCIKYQSNVNSNSILIDKASLGEKWILNDSWTEVNISRKIRFGDYFSAAMSVATLYNKAFILSEIEDIGDYYKFGNNILEKEIIRKAASPKGLGKNKEEYIIFPYYYEEGKLFRFNEEDFTKRFPNIVNYLKKYEKELSKRRISKNVKWFEYGRTQALNAINQPKLLLSTVITKKVKVYDLDSLTVPYTGIFITAKAEKNLNEAKEILESQEFMNYINLIGTNTTPNCFRITSKDIENFPL